MSASNSNQALAATSKLEEQQESPSGQQPKEQETAPFNLLQLVKKRQTLSSDFQPHETFGFIVGQRACGKSTLVNRWLEKSDPSSSSSSHNNNNSQTLEYSYARKNRSISTLKDVVHLWEYSGEDLSKWIEVPLNESSLQDSFVVVCCDLSLPVECFKYAFTALSQVHQYLDAKLDGLEKRGSKRPKAMRAAALKRGWSSHPDASLVKPCPVQLALFGLKLDRLSEICDEKSQKLIVQSMRWLAHSFGATLLLTSNQQDESGGGMAKKVLNNFAFRTAIKTQPLGADPRYIPAAADSFADMSLPPQLQLAVQSGGPLRAYTDILALLSNQKYRQDAKNKDVPSLHQYPDLSKYPEDLIDSLIADMRIVGK